MNGSYWIKPAGVTYAPTALVTWTTDERRIPSANRRDTVHGTAERISVCAVRRRRGKWSSPFRAEFLEVDAAHDWLEQWSHPGQRTYVVAPYASQALTLSDWWNRITLYGAVWDGKEPAGNDPAGPSNDPTQYSIQTLIMKGNPDVIRYQVNGRGICWLSGHQYFDMPESDLASAVSFVPHRDAPCRAGNDGRKWNAATRADLWLHAMQALVDWWMCIRGGPFGFTAGGLALSFFRSRLTKRSVLAHSHKWAKQIEAHAIHGGRAQAFYLGDVRDESGMRLNSPVVPGMKPPAVTDGPLTLWDVRSMYPHLLRDKVYPAVLQDVWSSPAVDWVRDAMKDSCVIARVRLETELPEYPFRHPSGILYPVGSFNATLCGPELERAFERGEVKCVYVACCYEPGRPFQRMSADLLAMRIAAREQGNDGWSYFIKLLSNSFSGKMSQKKGQWEKRPDVIPERDWGMWPKWDERTHKTHRYRAVAALVAEWCENEQLGRPMGASYAYLTAYGRERMLNARQSLPKHSVVSQDTDGLWVLDKVAGDRVAALLKSGDRPGQFADKYSSQFARFFSAKHYVTDRGWIMSGYHDFTPPDDCGSVIDHQTINPILGSPIAPPAFIIHRTRSTPMIKTMERGVIDPAGWVHPLSVREGRIVAPSMPSPDPFVASESLLSGL